MLSEAWQNYLDELDQLLDHVEDAAYWTRRSAEYALEAATQANTAALIVENELEKLKGR